MSKLVRFGVSLERELLRRFDQRIRAKNYTNRSEALRDLIREDLVRQEWKEDKEVAGAVTLMYDHHQRELLNRITDIQHDFQELIISTQHIHLDHATCLETIAVRGRATRIQKLTDALKAHKGVKHVGLMMSSTGRSLR